ncbi:MAG: toll/interleukin-1 receptor domain-containing protein [Pyrinomonadaceae bacterium]
MSSAEGQIFVSYSNRDSDFVHGEIRRLEGLGFRVWYDKEGLQPGLVWDKVICQAISTCACFMVFITRDALRSEHVPDEIRQALGEDKPFICVYLEKVELPTDLQRPMGSIQALERYAQRRYQYEGKLSKALAEYLKVEHPPEEKDKVREQERVPPPPPDVRPDPLPKIVFFVLVLLGAVMFFLALVAIIAPFFASATPGDPLGNPFVGLVGGVFFTGLALILEGGAYVVYRVYLRRKHG